MKITLIGYGKMGKVIENIALERGHTIVHKIDSSNLTQLQQINTENTDVVIEFTQPESAIKNILSCFDKKIPVVCGTTGWLNEWENIKKICEEKNGTLFYASNFSVGVNIFFHLNKKLAQIMNNFSNYAIHLEEIHHKEKKDAPSGTAITLAEGILNENTKKIKWVKDKTSLENELAIVSLREENVPGTHSIFYDSSEDTIEIKHTAHSRKGFAMGAVIAAEFSKDKKGILSMQDLLAF
ncbi:MAG: 4-hydroxy-tetrahydrodipicolinate reductase [Bacteroidetes bacterium]|nr:MAG: 4-hydroxy-tetrahydrodipicolinate reductase [Bacteroidota bacterium]TAG93470.1 MAG: 4-hydroxy-tetrahydrodipicolinate reductase [Bacteroidota bacterium]